MSCSECECNPIDSWDKRTDVPQYGSSLFQHEVRYLFPDRPQDTRLVSVYVLVRFMGQPPNVHGGGVYKIDKALGFEFLEGKMFSFGYHSVTRIEG